MANPRAKIKWDEIGADYLPMAIDASTITYDATKARGAETTMLDKAVTLSNDGVVALCADGNGILGRLERVESDGFCSVQWRGHCKLPIGNAATCTINSKIVGALGASSAKGYIRNFATGTAAEGLVARHMVISDASTPLIDVLLGV